MALPDVVDSDEWIRARKALLSREKELTRMHDQLNADRRRLPMVRIEKEYLLHGRDGDVGLAEMFDGRRQLIIQHFMFDPSWDDGCESCTASTDDISDGLVAHLNARDTSFALVSRAPLAKLEGYRQRKGWTLPWYSSADSDFNYDFHVSLDASKAPLMFNYRDQAELEAVGMGWTAEAPTEQPGVSAFLNDGDAIFHTYSTFGRGTEQLGGAYNFLDITALGRQEEWEEPKGRGGDGRPPNPSFT